MRLCFIFLTKRPNKYLRLFCVFYAKPLFLDNLMQKNSLTPNNQKTSKAADFAKSLKLPLALSISSCLLLACQSTPKATQPISQAPASTQAQQAIYNPYGVQVNTQPSAPQPIQLPDVGTQPAPQQPTVATPQTTAQQAPTYTGAIDQTTLTNLNSLLSARPMSLVQNDPQSLVYGSLWQRIVHGSRIAVPNNNARIDAERSWILSNQQYLTAVSARASRYLHHTVSEAERRGIPAELALLPILESSYDPSALSNSNASGLWQLIPSTGRIFGLYQSPSYDGRRDIVESTRAAYDFLTSLHNQFGSWELALAAYSASPSVVQAAINTNKSRNLPTDFWSLNLPKETMHYVPRFLALSQFLANSPRYNITLPNIANRRYFRGVPVNYGVSLHEISQATGVSFDELMLLNPALLNGRVEMPAPNRVLVPDQLDPAFDNKIRALNGNMAVAQQAQQSEYVISSRSFAPIQGGENELRNTNTLPTTSARLTTNGTIAPMPNLGTDEKQLIANQLANANPTIQPISTIDGNIQLMALATAQSLLNASGQVKVLQYGAPVSPTSHIIASVATPMPVTQNPTPATTEPVPTTTKAPSVNPATAPNTYQVVAGDSLGKIAQKYGMRTDELVKLNNLDKDAPLQIGQVLKIKAVPSVSTAKTNSTTTKTPSTPASNKTASETNKTASKAEPTKTVATNKTTTAPKTPAKKGVYTVVAGDTLLGVAKRFNTTQTEIAALNNFAVGTRLTIGQVINMPVEVKTETKAEPKPVVKTEPKPTAKPEPKAVQVVGKVIKNTEDYTVQPKDSLIGLAKRYNVAVEDLAKTNNLATNALLKNGQVIKIPKQHTSYTVKNGDSLIRLAKIYGISTEELAKLNGLKATDELKRGQVLTVPSR